MKQLHVVVGAQYGSEGKGAFVGALAARPPSTHRPLDQAWAAIRVGGPNAGHTVYTRENPPQKVVVRSVPAAVAVTRTPTILLIGPGSEVDRSVLWEEVVELEAQGLQINGRLFIHEQATVLEQNHRDLEGGNDGPLQQRIGSTGKGVGAARADRIMRTARIVAHHGSPFTVTDEGYRSLLFGRDVLLEGVQGFGLGLHAGHYPFCTSIDCTAADFIAMAGLSPWDYEPFVWVVARVHPIRVAGNSGPLAKEISWDELARRTGGYVQPERTTVTRKTRRVADWDSALVRRALEANGRDISRLVIMFVDYLDPACAGATDWDSLTDPVRKWLIGVEEETQRKVWYAGTGPHTGVWL